MRAVVLLLLLTFPSQAVAQFNYRFRVFPRGVKCDRSKSWCYTLPEFKLLVEYDNELFTARAQLGSMQERLKLHVDLYKNVSKQLQLALGSISVLQGETTRLSKKWATADQALQECKYDSPLWPWVILGITGAALLAAVGIIVGVYVSGGGK